MSIIRCFSYYQGLLFFLVLSTQFLFFPSTVFTQSCSISALNSQQAIDDFATLNPNCTHIEGDLVIREDSPGDITNLNGLSRIRSIEGSLVVRNNQDLVNLNGLDSLESIGDELFVFENQSLRDLTGLKMLGNDGQPFRLHVDGNDSLRNFMGLEQVTLLNTISIFENPSLLNFRGLDSLEAIYGSFGCSNNIKMVNAEGLGKLKIIQGQVLFNQQAAMVNFAGLEQLERISGSFSCGSNDQLTNFQGLEKLERIGSFFSCRNNPSLNNMEGLESLNEIRNSFNLTDNANLNTLEGLGQLSVIGENFLCSNNNQLVNLVGIEALVRIGNGLIIENNENLASLDGLNNLQLIIGTFTCTDNPWLGALHGLENINPELLDQLIISNCSRLSACAISSICNFLQLDDSQAIIENNDTGCDSREEIEEACLINSTTGQKEPSISIFPNPTNSYINIHTAKFHTIHIQLINSLGEIVLEKNNQASLDLSSFPDGIYFLLINTGDQQILKTVVKS